MARKNRNLAGFDEVANNNIKANADDHENVNPNINVKAQENDNFNDNVNTNEENNDNAIINVNENDNTSVNANENINGNINENANINVNDKNYDNPNDDINANDGINDNPPQLDYLDKLIGGDTKKKAENETVLTGIYLQKDLSQQLDRLAKRGGRGAKSRIVNEALRKAFMDKGLL